MFQHLAHAQGHLTLALEAYTGCKLTFAQVDEMYAKVAELEEQQIHLLQEISSRYKVLTVVDEGKAKFKEATMKVNQNFALAEVEVAKI